MTEADRAIATLNSIGDAILSTDDHGRVTYLNLAAEAMTGWSREEAAGRVLQDGSTRRSVSRPTASWCGVTASKWRSIRSVTRLVTRFCN